MNLLLSAILFSTTTAFAQDKGNSSEEASPPAQEENLGDGHQFHSEQGDRLREAVDSAYEDADSSEYNEKLDAIEELERAEYDREEREAEPLEVEKPEVEVPDVEKPDTGGASATGASS